jgi:hypothetical protein
MGSVKNNQSQFLLFHIAISNDASSSTSSNKVTMEVKIMTLAAVDVEAKGAHWELVAVAHIGTSAQDEYPTYPFNTRIMS